MNKIGIVCYPTYGGSGVFATELGKALATQGYEVHFITYEQPMRLDYLKENVFFHKVDIRTYPVFKYPPYELALSTKIICVMHSIGLDVLHVHYAIPHATAAYMARQVLQEQNINMPIITTLHGTDITLVGKSATYKPIVEFAINQSNMVTAVSNSLKQDTYSFFDIKKDITVIPNFIDLQVFKRENKDHCKRAICPNNEKLLIHVSNFRQVKRTTDVIHIFQAVKKKTAAKLLMVGDGPDRTACEELARDLRIFEDVRFLGKLESVQDLLSICDIFIMPSAKESFGLAALEALACGVPIVTSNTGGIPEVNINGYCGFMSEIGDIEGMAKQILYILEDTHLAQFKRHALKRAKVFDKSVILPKYVQLYQEVYKSFKADSQRP